MDLSKLNGNQIKAVTTTQGPVLVIAGAGTGKTSVLTHRVAYLISEIGVNSNRILAFTFTNKAAEEMKQRIARMVPHSNISWIRTYHSTCLMILKEDIDKLDIGYDNNFSIIDEDDQISLVKQIIKDMKLETKVRPKKFVSIIGDVKLDDVKLEYKDTYELTQKYELPGEQDAQALKVIFDLYQKRILAANQLDFSDLINYVHDLFEKRIDIRQKWSNRFDYILVDEFQDTNKKQFDIIGYLSNEQKNVFAVGDPNQTIYTWRGAYPEIFDDFVEFYGCKNIINLYLNYRSTPKILSGANNLINYNPTNFKNNLQPMNAFDSDVNVYVGNYFEDEANFICSTIKSFINQGKKYSDMLVLYRANYCSRSIEEKLMVNQIPYIVFGSVNFYARKEIKDLTSYLKAIYRPDDVSVMRIINVPRRAIGIDTVNTISAWATQHHLTFVQSINRIYEVDTVSDSVKTKITKFLEELKYLKTKLDSAGLINAIPTLVREIKYIEYLQQTETEVEDRQENIDALHRAILEFIKKNSNSNFIDFLNEINLYTSAEKTRVDNDQCVHLMTVHMAKGKEYDTVFIFNFDEGTIPSPRAIIEPGGLEEERRIAYVAMTRAINNLVITCTRDTGWSRLQRSISPSRFLKEIKEYKMAYRSTKQVSHQDLDWYDSQEEQKPLYEQVDLDQVYTNTEKFKVGDVIVHTVFGSGIVTAVNGSMIDVIFKKPYGKKTIVSSHKAIKRMVS